jgi:hypothetical protein
MSAAALAQGQMIGGSLGGLSAINYTPEQLKMLEERNAIETRREQALAQRYAREKALELACGTYGNGANPLAIVKAAEAFCNFIEGPTHDEEA